MTDVSTENHTANKESGEWLTNISLDIFSLCTNAYGLGKKTNDDMHFDDEKPQGSKSIQFVLPISKSLKGKKDYKKFMFTKKTS